MKYKFRYYFDIVENYILFHPESIVCSDLRRPNACTSFGRSHHCEVSRSNCHTPSKLNGQIPTAIILSQMINQCLYHLFSVALAQSRSTRDQPRDARRDQTLNMLSDNVDIWGKLNFEQKIASKLSLPKPLVASAQPSPSTFWVVFCMYVCVGNALIDKPVCSFLIRLLGASKQTSLENSAARQLYKHSPPGPPTSSTGRNIQRRNNDESQEDPRGWAFGLQHF